MMVSHTRCVLYWGTNRGRESLVRGEHSGVTFGDGPNTQSDRRSEFGYDRITSAQSQIEADLLICLTSFEGDPEARPPYRRQKPDHRQSVDRISALVCLLFRSSSLSFVAS
jgi:hypothetical protein